MYIYIKIRLYAILCVKTKITCRNITELTIYMTNNVLKNKMDKAYNENLRSE